MFHVFRNFPLQLIAFFILYFSFGVGNSLANWIPFNSPAGNFSALFPSTPQHQVNQQKTIVGMVHENKFQSESNAGIFTVEQSLLPRAAISLGGTNTILKKSVKAFLKKSGSQKLSVSDTTLFGEPAKELDFKASNGNLGKAKFVLFKKDQALFVLVGQSSQNGNLHKFFNSIKIK